MTDTAEPNFLLFENLIEPIDSAIKEIINIQDDIKSLNKEYLRNGTFVYIISLFESSLLEHLKRFLMSCPDKIKDGKISGKEIYYFKDSTYTFEIIEFLVDDYINVLSYENINKIIIEICDTIDLSKSTLNDSAIQLIEIKERRNILVHNDLKIDRKYIKNTKCDPRKFNSSLMINEDYLIDSIRIINEILLKLKNLVVKKFSNFTKQKLIIDIWDYFFASPLLKFEQYWRFCDNNIQFIGGETLNKYKNNLSSSERTLLAYFIQNYNPSLCDVYFKFRDLNMQVGTTKMAKMVEIFERYPLLLQ